MKSWFNVSCVKLNICSQFRTPKCPLCKVRATKEKLLSLFLNSENEQEEIEITTAEKRIEILEKCNRKLRLVVNVTCIYTTHMEETTV